ncbi:hypothetical protein VNI00_014314 [Paramarasmius palmivorus]|uniref:Major facilitator superfamily (MFS) profile domain-containing protein n=1 Tax=Paramarasmius palmivorus TaxID=297713 RepID=A0AAW0BTM2_9AGAR
MGSSIGGVIFPIMLNQLLAHGVEFGWAVRYTAFVVLAALIVANLVMTDRRAVGSRAAKPDIKKILGNAPYLLTVVGVFFVDLGITFPYFYLQLFSVTKGVDRNIAFYALAIINAASLPGRIIPNIIADRVGPYNVLVTCTVICGAIIFAMFGIKNIAGMVVFAVFYGFFSGAFLGLFAPAVASLSDAPSEIGVRLGIAYFLTGFGTLVGPPIDGALVGHELLELEWPGAIIFSAVTMLGGGFLLLVARQILVKRKGTQQV